MAEVSDEQSAGASTLEWNSNSEPEKDDEDGEDDIDGKEPADNEATAGLDAASSNDHETINRHTDKGKGFFDTMSGDQQRIEWLYAEPFQSSWDDADRDDDLKTPAVPARHEKSPPDNTSAAESEFFERKLPAKKATAVPKASAAMPEAAIPALPKASSRRLAHIGRRTAAPPRDVPTDIGIGDTVVYSGHPQNKPSIKKLPGLGWCKIPRVELSRAPFLVRNLPKHCNVPGLLVQEEEMRYGYNPPKRNLQKNKKRKQSKPMHSSEIFKKR